MVDQEALINKLRSNEVQALIQELFAVRLSDGPELIAQQIGQQLKEICSTPYAESIFEELNSQIEHVVVQISTAQPQLLSQIRQEAYFTRINATLEAIGRHIGAVQMPHDTLAEQQFWERYRSHVVEHHGAIEPPDFDRRRRVPIADLYVQPEIFEQYPSATTDIPRRLVDIYNDKEIDRTVLLGNPGGGKTTASNVLLYRHAHNPDLRTPFLITLREFGASDPPQWSVVEYLAYRLRTFYQCTAPDGAINRVLLTGGAFIVFDGLDELIDTSRRAEMSAIIEQFCVEYPLTQILVTSRIVGYEEARIDERQFTTLTIDGFSDELVDQYVHKWFSQESDTSAEDAARLAQALIQESSDIQDIRSNPLMLSLICILYRGERSIPQSRSDVYERCADLLFRKWDARRKIYVELRARHLIEPAIRYLAYWMLTRGQIQTAVSRRQLIAETTAYFRSRGFDETNDPAAAAEEFVDFCRGRAWVFSEVGSTGAGEQLYTFTHRTFMEYFAAYYLASINETPEQLVRALAPRVAKGEWDMVGQLAVQIKDRNVERGAERVFVALIGERRKRSPRNRLNVLEFLARCLASVQPRPSIIRQLMETILELPIVWDKINLSQPLFTMIENSHDSASAVAEALSAKISKLVEQDNPRDVKVGLELACCLPTGYHGRALPDFWRKFTVDNISIYNEKIVEAAQRGTTMLWLAYANDLVSPGEVISICAGELSRLFSVYWYIAFGFGLNPPIISEMIEAFRSDAGDLRLLTALGEHLMSLDDTPIISLLDDEVFTSWFYRRHFAEPIDSEQTLSHINVSGAAYLGLLFCVALSVEATQAQRRTRSTVDQEALGNAVGIRLAPLSEFVPYAASRLRLSSDHVFPPLAVDGRFGSYFGLWAIGELSFVSSFDVYFDPDLSNQYGS